MILLSFTSQHCFNNKKQCKFLRKSKNAQPRLEPAPFERPSVLDELNEKVQFSSKVRFLVNFELNLVHFSKKELELN